MSHRVHIVVAILFACSLHPGTAVAQTTLELELRVQTRASDLMLDVSLAGTDGNRILINPRTMSESRFAQLRARYPLQSLAERLVYEKGSRRGEEVRLSARSSELLMQEEESLGNYSMRTASLAALHSGSVNDFVRETGFGNSRVIRMPTPSPEYLPAPPSQPLDLVQLPPLSSEEDSYLPVPLGLAAVNPATSRGPSMPTLTAAALMHETSRWNFAEHTAYVRNVNEVAGFQSHAFSFVPRLPTERALREYPHADSHLMWWLPYYESLPPYLSSNTKQAVESLPPVAREAFAVVRLELVSMLKHAQPQVYVSGQLPRMNDLQEYETRSLDKFEAASLTKLQDGGELETSATPNRIVMLGAIRASKQCLQCHEVPRGTLLGAFSYELRRDPPVMVKHMADVVQ